MAGDLRLAATARRPVAEVAVVAVGEQQPAQHRPERLRLDAGARVGGDHLRDRVAEFFIGSLIFSIVAALTAVVMSVGGESGAGYATLASSARVLPASRSALVATWR